MGTKGDTTEGNFAVQDIIDLDHDECERLLRAGVAGRIAIATPTGPHIIPVNYSVVDEAIVVRTSPYSLLGSYGRDTTLAFEVDQFDYENQRGWSVVARGRGDFVTDIDEMDHIREVWSPGRGSAARARSTCGCGGPSCPDAGSAPAGTP